MARDLRSPGLRAFFCHATKEGKNALKGVSPLENPPRRRPVADTSLRGGIFLRYDLIVWVVLRGSMGRQESSGSQALS